MTEIAAASVPVGQGAASRCCGYGDVDRSPTDLEQGNGGLMLRFHLTDADLARVHVATAPDPLWETVLGVQQLTGQGSRLFGDWRIRARDELTQGGLGGSTRLLNSIAPAAGYFPDFLTPHESGDSLAAGLEVLQATPPARLRREVSRLGASRRLPRWFHGLAVGEYGHLAELTRALRGVHDAVIAPDWAQVAAAVEADRMLRARAVRDRGLHGLLESLRPVLDWRPPTLYVPYPEHREVHLAGRGLRLVPSYFCWRTPVALADPSMPQVLVYPVARPDTEEAPTAATAGGCRLRPLAGLLGRTRARVLVALADAATTGELAKLLNISAASASEHVRALRDTGLAHDRRERSRVVHSLTPLGEALLRGETAAAPGVS